MFGFSGEVLITEIIDAIERIVPVPARLFPALPREPAFVSLSPKSEQRGDIRPEGCSVPWAEGNALLDALFLPCICVTPCEMPCRGRWPRRLQLGRVLGCGRHPLFCSRLSLVTALLSKSHLMPISTSLESGSKNLP